MRTRRSRSLDRRRVAGLQTHEVAYLSKKFSLTRYAVRAAVKLVGHRRAAVEQELMKWVRDR